MLFIIAGSESIDFDLPIHSGELHVQCSNKLAPRGDANDKLAGGDGSREQDALRDEQSLLLRIGIKRER